MANISEYGDDDKLDPRIKGELEALNSAAESINKLENEIQKARSLFKKHKAECATILKELSHTIGKKLVSQAQPYYEITKKLNKNQLEAQKVAARFQKASSVHKLAQETVSLAEQQLVTDDGSKLSFDDAWQDMLNHANLRFMEAEREKRAFEEEHKKCSDECSKHQSKLVIMKKDMGKAIEKSKPFYELKGNFEKKLQIEKQNAEDLQLALVCSKQKYKLALMSLEQISEEIHMQRDCSKLPRRTPGVGAESDACSEFSELLSTNLDFFSDTSSQVSRDDFASEFCLSDGGTWSQDDLDGSVKNSGNMLDSFFSKVSKRFNRSSSLGNISGSLNLQLQLPAKEINLKHTHFNENEDGGIMMASTRDGTVEGAEQTPGECRDVVRRRESDGSRPPMTFKSTVFLPISHPIDVAKRQVTRVGPLSTESDSYGSKNKAISPKVYNVNQFVGMQNFKHLNLQKKSTGNHTKLQHSVGKKAFQIDKNIDPHFSLKESF